MIPLRRPVWLWSSLALLCAPFAAAEPLPRPSPHAGTIVAAKGGEELQFARQAVWRPAEIRQDLLGGDTLRTNAIGNLAILFADQTQVRVGRNSVLVVRDIVGNGPARLALPVGNLWARAARGGRSVTVQTPAAAAAIRGTDWSLAVDGQGRTALVVLEGVVEFSNPQGSVTVRQGEAAFAAIGQRPTKILLVSPKDREQMMFYLSLRDAFTWLPASPLERRRMRAEHARLLAIPPAARTGEDWLSLAEIGLSFEGRAFAQEALRQARAKPLSQTQQARADLVQALIAGAEQRWAESRDLFDRALPRLQGRQRTVAAYGRYFAAALAEPTREPPRPGNGIPDDAYAALSQAWIAGFRESPEAALTVVREAERRFPNEIALPAARSRIAAATDHPDEMRDAVARTQAIDPDDPYAIAARAYYKGEIQSDLDGALADFRKVVAIVPGNSGFWNDVGLIEIDRDDYREAERALRRAIETDPEDPVAHANYAILLLDQSRMDEAKTQIDRVFQLDPAFHAGYTALGRYYLQTGNNPKAVENLLAASAADPANSNTLLALAVTYYQNGDIVPALQQLDNSDRLDPNDPIVPLVRTAIALDRYEADTAITSARESVRRFRARGGYYSPLASTRQNGSYLANAFRFLELNDWGRFYGDAAFDPFSATGYFDRAITSRPDLFLATTPLTEPFTGETVSVESFPLLIQGLLLDPLAIGSRTRRTDLLRQPFLDTTVGGGLVARDGRLGWTALADAQGFSNHPFPVSFFANASGLDASGDRRNDRQRSQSGSFFVGANPRPYDHVVLFSIFSHTDPLLPGPVFFPTPHDDRDTFGATGGIAWGHEFGNRDVLTSAAVVERSHDRLFRSIFGGLATRRQKAEQTTALVAVSHLYGPGPVTVQYGADVGTTGSRAEQEIFILAPPPISAANRARVESARVYADVTARATDRIQIEGGAFGALLHGDDTSIDRFEPRAGIAYMPTDGQWLRAMVRKETELPGSFTLSPVTTLGLLSNPLPLATGGRALTFAARWDAEWSAHVFTALDYQHQDAHRLSTDIPQTIDTFDIGRARIDRVAATANAWLGGGFGLFALAAFMPTEIRDSGPGHGSDLPFVPRHLERIGATWTHPSRVKVVLAQTFIGSRAGEIGGRRLGSDSTTDITLTWEPLERLFEVDLALLNLLDRSYLLAPGISAPDRVFLGSVRVRF